ncbi:MAG: hypothetical protein AAGG65_17660 [Pseudomonadota bacterium]
MAGKLTKASFSVDFTSFGFSGDRDGIEILLRACDGQVGVGRISHRLAALLAKQLSEWSDGLGGVS